MNSNDDKKRKFTLNGIPVERRDEVQVQARAFWTKVQADKADWDQKMAAAKQDPPDRAERELAWKMLQDVINEARTALQANSQTLAAHGKAIQAAEATRGATPELPDLVPYIDLTGLFELWRAAHNYQAPFPPEHLKAAWADFKARSANQ